MKKINLVNFFTARGGQPLRNCSRLFSSSHVNQVSSSCPANASSKSSPNKTSRPSSKPPNQEKNKIVPSTQPQWDTARGHYENRNLLHLKERGLVVSVFPNKEEEFEKLVASGPQACYCGFDPTAPSLHVGNLLALISLLHCQRRGHTPVVIIGSATASIGDPSGKTKERDILDLERINENARRIQKNVEKIFHNHHEFIWPKSTFNIQLQHQQSSSDVVKIAELRSPKILNNMEWYEKMSVIEFMSFARHFRMGDLLSRKHIETRLASSEGINFTEFSYQLFQSFDWLYLLRNHGCSIQLGGNDQTGNITSGHDLISKIEPKRKTFGITLPIITTDKGEKLGKSAGNALWLDDEMLSSYEFYQSFLNTSDKMVETYLKIFTFLPLTEIEDLMRKHRQTPEKFFAQRKLASELTTLVHGESGLESAIKCTQALFYGDRESLAKMTESEVSTVFKGAKTVTLTLEPGVTAIECAMKANCFKNLEDADTKIRSGGFRINHTLITNPQEALIYGQHILNNNISVIRVGKKTYHLVRWLA